MFPLGKGKKTQVAPTTTPAPGLHALPAPDERGNRAFGRLSDGNTPAILKSGLREGMFYASAGKGGMIWDGTSLRYFATPEEAMAALVEAGALR